MCDVVEGVNYELSTIELVVDAPHKAAGGSAAVELSGSGHTFDFEAAEPWAGSRRIHATAQGWREFKPRLVWAQLSPEGR